jgi:hypothetical protein
MNGERCILPKFWAPVFNVGAKHGIVNNKNVLARWRKSAKPCHLSYTVFVIKASVVYGPFLLARGTGTSTDNEVNEAALYILG